MERLRQDVVVWIGREIIPHEPAVRAWLKRNAPSSIEAEDILQEAYCRLSDLQSVEQIANPRAYFFSVARNLLLNAIRHARVIRISSITDLELATLDDGQPSPERVVAGRRELERVRDLLASLPERCRRIIEMRKVEGLSQREIAERLNVTENVVENNVSRGLRFLSKAVSEDPIAPSRAPGKDHDRTKNSKNRP
ncbi:sigma-70 family RNA polymerase sigma factor [Caulobacter sp.]|uniref:RNA polymerase sigma factor n=1 Tax=Caulobacter sp. TaxID=78 RepID=UPI001B2D4227|nr:sigma-70 family RNA polymerase sigma factor [Caulobacter sp.]MBO9546366.1 sigma-70 family RNA polymerase sigma factor [Caulobacter sp.]